MTIRFTLDHTVLTEASTGRQLHLSNLLRIFAIAIGVFIFSFLSAQATFAQNTFFVRTDGADSPTCNGLANASAASAPDCAFLTINNAITNAAAGDTINVAAGTYAENVTISKALTILGAQSGQNANLRFSAFIAGPNGPKADPTVESIITPPAVNPTGNANNAVHVMADNITFDGFVVDGNNFALAQGSAVVVGGINTDSRRGIESENASGTFVAVNNLSIDNCIVQNFAQRGIELVNGLDSASAPATTGCVINANVIRNFSTTGIVIAFNSYTDITANTITGADVADACVMIQDFTNAGATPRAINVTNNSLTVGQDSIGIWANLMHANAPAVTTVTIANNTINTAIGVDGASDFTDGIFLAALEVGTAAQLNGNIIGSSGGQFARGISLWDLQTTVAAIVNGGAIGNSVIGISLHDDDPGFGLAGANSIASVSGVNIAGTTTGILSDATGSTGDTVALQVSGNTSVSNTTTAISVTGANASANIHDNAASIHDNTVGINVDGGSATITNNNLFANMTSLSFSNGAGGNVHFNRIISPATAINNPNNLTPNLENNWWGCNAGPGNAGCGAVTGAGADFDPWIVLGAIASPSSIQPFGTSTITADMTKNSDGAAPAGTLPNMLVAFTATEGTISPTSGTVTAGQASSMFTSTSSTTGMACATVDGQEACVPVTIDTSPPTVSYTPIPNTGSTSNPTLVVTATDDVGVTAVSIFVSVDGGTFNANPCTFAGGTPQNGTWNCTVSGTMTNPSSIAYYVTAQDAAGNANARPAAAGSAPDLYTIGAGEIPAGTYSNASLANGAFLGGNVTILDVLTLNGLIDAGVNTLTVACTSTVSGAGAGSYVTGNVEKDYCGAGPFTYPVGTPNGYSPVDANVTAVGGGGDSLAVKAVQNRFGANGETPALDPTSLQRYWDLNKIGNITANIKFTFLPGDLVGGGADYTIIRISGADAASFANAPDCPANPNASPCVNAAGNYMFMAAISNFSRWTAGPALAPTSTKATLSGRVLSSSGRPIANAHVVLAKQTGELVAMDTGSLGYFSFPDLPTGQTYVITVNAGRDSFANPNQVFNLENDVVNADFVAEPRE